MSQSSNGAAGSALAQAHAEGKAQRRGIQVIAILAVLTVAEYIVAVGLESPALLVVLLSAVALVKAWLILVEFMHLPRAWRPEGHEGGH